METSTLQYFLTPTISGNVFINSAPDDTQALIRTEQTLLYTVQLNIFRRNRARYPKVTTERTADGALLTVAPREDSEPLPDFQFESVEGLADACSINQARWHHRIVFDEVGEPFEEQTTFGTMFRMLQHAVFGLK